jgi:hypothetical protein
MLIDPYAAVRYLAAESLQRLPGCAGVENRFDAQQAERDRERCNVIDIWSRQGLKLLAEASGRAMLLKGRRVLEEEVQRLKAIRDETPITIYE